MRCAVVPFLDRFSDDWSLSLRRPSLAGRQTTAEHLVAVSMIET